MGDLSVKVLLLIVKIVIKSVNKIKPQSDR
jgi:hypothetical protein